MQRKLLALFLGLVLAHPLDTAAAARAPALAGLPLEEAIQRLAPARGSILYSSDLVRPDMQVLAEPAALSLRARLAEIVAPHGLSVAKGPGGSLLIVRAASTPAPRDDGAVKRQQVVMRETALLPIAEIVVNASQYALGLEPASSISVLTGAELQSLPGLGDDSLRAVSRLPGAAASELTARANIRGGETDETLVRYDGLRLFNPYHLKDFQAVFSTIDPGLVQRMDVSTGGFPARFGSRMSGVIDIAGVQPAEHPYREVSLSFLNTAALASGALGDGATEWLVAARRSNLDLLFELLEPRLGSPTYAEVHGRLSRRFSDAWAASGSFLVFDDDLKFRAVDDEEVTDAEYRDSYLWLRADYTGARVSGSALVSWSDIDSQRIGLVEQPGVASGELDDRRDASIFNLKTDWAVSVGRQALLQFGADWQRSQADYDYTEEVLFELLFDTPGAPTETFRERDLHVSPSGSELGAYASLRLEVLDPLTIEAGLRWDRETLSVRHDSDLTPRLSVLYEPAAGTQLRASWGRFLQPQTITELQIADGVTQFQRAQLAEHAIASLDQRLGPDIGLRLEAYRKSYRRLRPRYENLLHTLILIPELKPDRLRIAPERATADGVELSLRSSTARDLSWWAGYTWARVRDEVAGERIARTWDQRHAVNAGLAWRGEKWDMSLAGSYRSGWPTTAVSLDAIEPVPTVAVGPRNALRLGHSLSLDGRIARNFRFADGDSLTLFLEVTNLLDRTNPCCVEFEINSDSGELDLNAEPVSYFRILPSLGFIWRF